MESEDGATHTISQTQALWSSPIQGRSPREGRTPVSLKISTLSRTPFGEGHASTNACRVFSVPHEKRGGDDLPVGHVTGSPTGRLHTEATEHRRHMHGRMCARAARPSARVCGCQLEFLQLLSPRDTLRPDLILKKRSTMYDSSKNKVNASWETSLQIPASSPVSEAPLLARRWCYLRERTDPWMGHTQRVRAGHTAPEKHVLCAQLWRTVPPLTLERS